jgi:hypothetical protein
MPFGPRFVKGLFQEGVELVLGHSTLAEILVDWGQDLGK